MKAASPTKPRARPHGGTSARPRWGSSLGCFAVPVLATLLCSTLHHALALRLADGDVLAEALTTRAPAVAVLALLLYALRFALLFLAPPALVLSALVLGRKMLRAYRASAPPSPE